MVCFCNFPCSKWPERHVFFDLLMHYLLFKNITIVKKKKKEKKEKLIVDFLYLNSK